MTVLYGYIVGLIGMWFISDAIWSINYYLGSSETFWRNQLYRVVRLLMSIVLIVIGLLLLG